MSCSLTKIYNSSFQQDLNWPYYYLIHSTQGFPLRECIRIPPERKFLHVGEERLHIKPHVVLLRYFVANWTAGLNFIEDDLWLKIFYGRTPLMKNNWSKTAFDGGQPLRRPTLWRKPTFDGNWPFTETDLWQKMTFDGRQPLMEDNLLQKTTFDRKQPLK